jgi:hypothetical protein
VAERAEGKTEPKVLLGHVPGVATGATSSAGFPSHSVLIFLASVTFPYVQNKSMARAGPGSGEVIFGFQSSGDLCSERAPFPHSTGTDAG